MYGNFNKLVAGTVLYVQCYNLTNVLKSVKFTRVSESFIKNA